MGYKIYLGDFLRRLRLIRGLSLSGLSRRTTPRVSPQYISLLEKGERERPSQKVVDSLLRALEVNDKESQVFGVLIRHREINSEVVDFYLSNDDVKADDLIALCLIAANDRDPNTKSSSFWWNALNALRNTADQDFHDWEQRVIKNRGKNQ